MFLTMVIAALIVNGTFSVLGLIASGPRPTRADIFSSIQVNYKLALSLLGIATFAALFWLTAQRGATDPVCGMSVDRDKALTMELDGKTFYFCSNHCRHALAADPRKYLRTPAPANHAHRTHAHYGTQSTGARGLQVSPPHSRRTRPPDRTDRAATDAPA